MVLYAGGALPESSGGGGGGSKYGVSLDGLLGDVDENGVLQAPTEYIDFVGKGIKNVGFRKNLQLLENYNYIKFREYDKGLYEYTIC